MLLPSANLPVRSCSAEAAEAGSHGHRNLGGVAVGGWIAKGRSALPISRKCTTVACQLSGTQRPERGREERLAIAHRWSFARVTDANWRAVEASAHKASSSSATNARMCASASSARHGNVTSMRVCDRRVGRIVKALLSLPSR